MGRVDTCSSAAISRVLTLAFTTESGYTAAMETLGVETAPVTLLAAEAMTGATPISFSAPKAE